MAASPMKPPYFKLSSVSNVYSNTQDTMQLLLLTLICSLAGSSLAQFQFFEQMFNQGGQQQQQRQQQQEQNVASDSAWYQKTYEGGTITSSCATSCHVAVHSKTLILTSRQLAARITSALAPSPAFTSHIIARAHSLLSKTRWNWERGVLSV